MIALMVALGAIVGAPTRYLTDRAMQSRHRTALPWGTLTVNVVASLILGVVVSSEGRLNADLAALIGTGFCGALSTYSTFSYETMRLNQQKAHFYAVANVVLSLIAGLTAASLGWVIGACLG